MFGDRDEPSDIPNMFESETPLEEREGTPAVLDLTPKPIPEDIVELAEYIKSLRRNHIGLPSRNMLRKDDKLKGEVSRKTGVLKQERNGSKLRPWSGDSRLFPPEMWAWLCDEVSHNLNERVEEAPKKRKAVYDGHKPEKKRKTTASKPKSKRSTKDLVGQTPVEILPANAVDEIQAPLVAHANGDSAVELMSAAPVTDRPTCTSPKKLHGRNVPDDIPEPPTIHLTRAKSAPP